MNKKLGIGVLLVVVVVAIIVGIYFTLNNKVQPVFDPLNATYTIDGQPITLVNGKAEAEGTTVFGQPTVGDLNNDGKPDAAMILVQDPGGSGTFYYVAAAINMANVAQGTNAVLLGDRVAPQNVEVQNGQIIANYADRNPGEPMSTPPSVGISMYLTYDGTTLKVIPQNSTSSDSGKGTVKGSVLLGPTCPVERIPPDPNCAPRPYKTSINIQPTISSIPAFSISTDASGTFAVELDPGTYTFHAESQNNSALPRCSDSQATVTKGSTETITINCDTGIR